MQCGPPPQRGNDLRRAAERLIWIKSFAPLRGALGLPKKPVEETLIRIEETQAALRDSIARAKELTEESERLVRSHRKAMAKPTNPQS